MIDDGCCARRADATLDHLLRHVVRDVLFTVMDPSFIEAAILFLSVGQHVQHDRSVDTAVPNSSLEDDVLSFVSSTPSIAPLKPRIKAVLQLFHNSRNCVLEFTMPVRLHPGGFACIGRGNQPDREQDAGGQTGPARRVDASATNCP